MSRGIILAPVARNLNNDFPLLNVVKIPQATNGVQQGWDTLDANTFVAMADPQLTIYTRFKDIPLAVRKYLIQFHVFLDIALTQDNNWKRWIDCLATDFISVNGGIGKAVTNLIAGDIPDQWYPMLEWQGKVQDTLSTPQ